MKLIDAGLFEKKLITFDLMNMNIDEILIMVDSCALDPAGLELGYAKAWGKLETWLKTGIEYFESLEKTAMNQERIHRYKMVLEKIAGLESGLDPGKIEEIWEKAGAWEILREDEKGLGLGHEMKTALAQARADLKKRRNHE